MKVLIAVDDSRASRDAVDFAARLLDPDDETIVVNVASVHPPLAIPAGGLAGLGGFPAFAVVETPIDARRFEAARAAATDAELMAENAGDRLDAAARIVTGDPVERIVDVATEENVDLVVVGTRDAGLFERILTGGSTSRDVVAKAPCSVLVVR